MENRVVVSICGEDYTFVAEEAPSYMQRVGSYVSEKMEAVLSGARVGRTDAAVLTAANIADELFKEQAAAEQLRRQIKGYLDEAAKAQAEASELKREVFRLQQRLENRNNGQNRQNSNGGNGIGASFYFWDNVAATNTYQTGAGATTWAVFNAASSIWNESGSYTGLSGTSVKPGQAFIVPATGTSVTFDNSMRNSDAASFVNKVSPSAGGNNRYWLQITAPDGSVRSTAVTYIAGASDAFDA